MPDWLVSRATVITLAVIGGVISLVVSQLHGRGRIDDAQAKKFNRVGYGFMWASIALFIYAGFRAGYQ